MWHTQKKPRNILKKTTNEVPHNSIGYWKKEKKANVFVVLNSENKIINFFF